MTRRPSGSGSQGGRPRSQPTKATGAVAKRSGRQAQLGALTPEVVTKDAQLARLEAMTPGQLQARLEELADEHGKQQLTIGVGLWMLRRHIADAEYGSYCKRLAARMDVDLTTLWRWRSKAQTTYKLPDPPGSQPARKARSIASRNPQPSAGRPPPLPSANEDDSKVDDAGGGTASTRVAEGAAPPATQGRPPDPPRGTGPPSRSDRGDTAPSPAPHASAGGPGPVIGKGGYTGIGGLSHLRRVVQELVMVGVDEAATTLELVEAAELLSWAQRVEKRAVQYRAAPAKARAAAAAKTPADSGTLKRAPSLCDHPKSKLTNKGWGTICDPAKKGCGAKVS